MYYDMGGFRMQLIELKEGIFYIPGVLNTGVVTANGSICGIIDCGIDKNAAKRILNILKKNGLVLRDIFITHAHADHFGAASYLRLMTDATVTAPLFESCIMEHPFFEPYYLFSGASPPDELKTRILMAENPCAPDRTVDGTENITLGEMRCTSIPLKGHTINHMGLEVNGVLFTGDAVLSETVLRKYKLPFLSDVHAQLNTLNKLMESVYDLYMPSHSEPFTCIREETGFHHQTILKTAQGLKDIAYRKRSTEEMLENLYNILGIKEISLQQYYLANTTLHAFLSYLACEGVLNSVIEKNCLYWQTAK